MNTNLERRVWAMFFFERSDTFLISRSLQVTEADAERIVNREMDARRRLVDGDRSVERLLEAAREERSVDVVVDQQGEVAPRRGGG